MQLIQVSYNLLLNAIRRGIIRIVIGVRNVHHDLNLDIFESSLRSLRGNRVSSVVAGRGVTDHQSLSNVLGEKAVEISPALDVSLPFEPSYAYQIRTDAQDDKYSTLFPGNFGLMISLTTHESCFSVDLVFDIYCLSNTRICGTTFLT